MVELGCTDAEIRARVRVGAVRLGKTGPYVQQRPFMQLHIGWSRWGEKGWKKMGEHTRPGGCRNGPSKDSREMKGGAGPEGMWMWLGTD